MEPPAFPTSEADLAEWSVYADYLQTRGDPRGELIAHDLALDATPDPDALHAFHTLAEPLCAQRGTTKIGWCLGHARTLAMRLSPHRASTDTMHDLLREPALACLESIAIIYEPGTSHAWRRALAVLPPTCKRLDVRFLADWSFLAAEEVLAIAPPTVDTLGLSTRREPPAVITLDPAPKTSFALNVHVTRLISDRFAVLDLIDAPLTREVSEAVVAALRATRVTEVRTAERLSAPRCRVGAPDDAGVIGERTFARVPPWSLELLQERHGLVGARAQLARSMPEHYLLRATQAAIRVAPFLGAGHLAHQRGRWTLHDRDDTQFTVEPLWDTNELRNGSVFTIRSSRSYERIACTLVTRDLDARLREWR